MATVASAGQFFVTCGARLATACKQVIGEVYDVDDDDLRRMDRSERVGDPEGYERVVLAIERFDGSSAVQVRAFAYVKQAHSISAATPRIGPLQEYQQQHAVRFHWTGTT